MAAGEHDVFLPEHRLGPATARVIGTGMRVLSGAGHLAVDERPEAVVALVEEIYRRAA